MKKMKKADAILCADLHIREDQPECRTDNYFSAQNKKLSFILKLARDNFCPIICAGDFFDKAKSSKNLEIFVMNLIRYYTDYNPYKNPYIYIVPGNHDLPYHNLNEMNNSSLGILEASGIVYVQKAELGSLFVNNMIPRMRFLITHRYIDVGSEAGFVDNFYWDKLELYDAKFLLCGDNHITFCRKYKNRFILNPGSMMRMTADQEDHRPCVFLYYADDNSIEQIFLPIEENVITREHIEKTEIENKNMMAYIKRMDKDYNLTFDFNKNINNYFTANKTKKSVEEITRRFVE